MDYPVDYPPNLTELPYLSAAAGFLVLHANSVTSTQDRVRERLPENPPPLALISDHQSAGRGRRGSPWLDEPGASLLMSTAIDPARLSFSLELLPLAVGLVVARAVEAMGVGAAQIKWPNDILVGGRKLCGVLVETVFMADGLRVAVIGTGMNVTAAPAGETGRTALAEHAPGADRFEVAEELLVRLREPDFDACEYAARDYLLGRRVVVGEVSGTAAGLDASGALLVQGEDGRPRAVRAGEARVGY